MALERRRARERQAERDTTAPRGARGQGRSRQREIAAVRRLRSRLRSTASDGTASSAARSPPAPATTSCMSAWADPAAPKPAPTIRVLKSALTLPASHDDGADVEQRDPRRQRVLVREAPVPAGRTGGASVRDRRHRDHAGADAMFTRDEKLSVAFQVINAAASDDRQARCRRHLPHRPRRAAIAKSRSRR